MADQYRRKALIDQFGIAEGDDPNAPTEFTSFQPDPGQQASPAAPPAELPSPPFAGDAPGLPPVGAPPAAPPSWNKGANAGKNSGMILGFDTDKLNDPGSGSAAGSKYTSAAKAFSGGLKEDVGVSRGGLDNMNNYLKANGFPNAQVVGDDKIDFGDGMGPIDVIRSDGQIVFQNTSGNPIWEGQGFKSDVGGGGGGTPLAGPQSNLDGLLQGSPMEAIQAEIAKLMQGGNRPNLQALLGQLGGAR